MPQLKTITIELPSADPNPGPLCLKLFPSWKSFREHFDKHVLSEDEPWDRVFSRKQLKRIAKEIEAGNVSFYEAAYEELSAAIEENLRACIALPCYVLFREHVEMGRQSYIRDGRHFICPDGCIVATWNGAVRSVYYSGGQKDSKRRLFELAWRSAKAQYLHSERTSRHGSEKHEVVEKVTLIRKVYVTEANWRRPPRL